MRARIFRYLAIAIMALLGWVASLFIAGAVIESRVPVTLPASTEVIQLGDGYAKASGTWVIDGDKQGFPLQTTEITCERELKRCTSATAQIMLGKQLAANLDSYEITSWEKGRIVFFDDSPNCVSYVFTIDLASKSVAGVRRPKPSATAAIGDCSVFSKELRLYLRNGSDVAKQLRDEAVPWFGHLVFSPFKLLN
jgi:hypothetical protein